MLFGSAGLASEIERAECGLLRASIRAIAELHPERDAGTLPVAGGVAAYSGEGSPLNKVAGLGFHGPPGQAEIESVERFFIQRRSSVQVELSTLADADIAPMLTGRGYRLLGFENVLGRDLTSPRAPSPTAGSEIELEKIDDGSFAAWMDTVVTGFLTPDEDGVPAHESFSRETLEEVMSDMRGAEGIVRYLAYRDGDPAGGASMRIQDRIAQLTGASTLPRHRRRGVQTALLARRLEDAARAGCEVAVVTTQPGSTSQKNAQRNRFELLYTRAILVLRQSD